MRINEVEATGTKAAKVSGAKKKNQLLGHFATNQVTWQQLSKVYETVSPTWKNYVYKLQICLKIINCLSSKMLGSLLFLHFSQHPNYIDMGM